MEKRKKKTTDNLTIGSKCFLESLNEIWLDAKGYEGFYQVSNFGRVKSLGRNMKNSSTDYKILKGYINPKGYCSVHIGKNENCKSVPVHKLIATTFLGHVPCGMKIVIDHIDNNKSNNHVSNLQLISSRLNASKDIKGVSSEYTGVSWSDRLSKWRSSIKIKDKCIHLGLFTDEKEASEYYQNAIIAFENNLPIKLKRYNYSSKYKYISFIKNRNKWTVSIFNKNIKKKIFIGHFKTEEEALIARNIYLKTL